MTDYFAVIDLGTNTFHLIIGWQKLGVPKILYRKRYYVKLARSGIGNIHPEALKSAKKACQSFREKLDEIPVQGLLVLGTAALRTATNAPELTQTLESILGAPIKIISGEEEARLIANGVSVLLKKKHMPALIMDIGGGSVEFVKMDRKTILWSASFPVGVAVLFNSFHQTDPIPIADQVHLNAWLDEHLLPLVLAHSEDQPITLIGAAGIYEILARCLGIRKSSRLKGIEFEAFSKLADEIIGMNLKTRQDDPRIPKNRADLFPVALLLIRWVLTNLEVKQLAVSPYAMKEGALLELASMYPAYSSSAVTSGRE
ncbi:MAG: hypothetical protein KA479_14170 [Saprospiraceae bacterium]|nr:hypothetical protein [Saprospiraceae bacterium]